jgi:hypothetical protein
MAHQGRGMNGTVSSKLFAHSMEQDIAVAAPFARFII